MPLVLGATFSRADILSAAETLAWSSLPVLADQAVQQLFYKNVPVNPKIDRNIAGFITCAIVILTLPKDSPARIGAPCFFLAYRFALSFWNRKPKPATNDHKPPPAAPKAAPSTTHKSAKKPAPPIPPKAGNQTTDGRSPPPPAAGPAPKQPEEKASSAATSGSSSPPPAAAKGEPAAEEPKQDPEKKKNEASPAKPPAGTASPPATQERINRIQEQAKAAMAQIERLDREVRQNLMNISVKVKITYLPQKETESEPKQKIIPKEPEVITTAFYIQPQILFKFPKEMVPTLQKEMKKQYSITENTSFCWVLLGRNPTEPSRFPFVYFPIEILKPIAGKKKKVVLRIHTEGQIFEIEFLRAGTKDIGKCLEKLEKSERNEIIQPDAYLGSPSNMSRKDVKELSKQIQTSLTMAKCYLTPFEKK